MAAPQFVSNRDEVEAAVCALHDDLATVAYWDLLVRVKLP